MITLSPMGEVVGFYYNLGRAISSWATVEDSLLGIVSSIFKEDHDLVMKAYFSSESFRPKLAFASSILTERLAGNNLERWNELKGRTYKLSEKRNEIAHWKVIGEPIGMGIPLFMVDPKGKKGRGHAVYDLFMVRYEFIVLARDMDQLACKIRGEDRPFPEYPIPTHEDMCKEIQYATTFNVDAA